MGNLGNLREQILSQKPTDQQRDAIFTDELEFLLRAAPGSGKTWTSCRRFIWRGANWPYSVGGLALLSFTNAAIREFQEATIRVGRRDLLSDPNCVGTFDSFVERFILTPFGHLIVGLSKRPKLFIAPRPGDWNNNNLMAWTQLKGGRKTPVPAWEINPYPDNTKIAFKASRAFGGKKLQLAGSDPVTELMKLGFYTHSQRIYWACRLLFGRTHIADLIARRFPEIVVDEAQDTNVWLLILLNFLRERGTRITLIGDPDQCIYEFSMADATSLTELKKKWNIPEKPLSQSFRCNNQIADAVRNIGGNQDFGGCGDCCHEHRRPIILRENGKRFVLSVAEFKRILDHIGINEASSAIICRGHSQLETIRGEINYTNLKGKTRELAQAAFFRDCRKDYKRAFQIVEKSVRSIVEDDNFWENVDESSESEIAHHVGLTIWRFVRSESGLPPLSFNGSEWITRLRHSLEKLIFELGIKNVPALGRKIRKTGLQDNQMALPLFEAQANFPAIRQETIHQVKGESIDAVLVLGSSKFWNSVVDSVINDVNSEDKRLAYVAMTRARHLLVVGLPASHYDKHAAKWISWGFNELRE
jgi:superfamily I DNA/RNA helicase